MPHFGGHFGQHFGDLFGGGAIAIAPSDAEPKHIRIVRTGISVIASAGPAVRLQSSPISVILVEVTHG